MGTQAVFSIKKSASQEQEAVPTNEFADSGTKARG